MQPPPISYKLGRDQLPNPNECDSTLTSGTRGETLTPNPNECHSTLTSVIKGIYPCPYIYIYISSDSSMIFRQHLFNKRTRQSASSKTKEVYVKNKTDITVYSEMHVVALCCIESQVKIAEEQCKSDLSATPTCNMPWPS